MRRGCLSILIMIAGILVILLLMFGLMYAPGVLNVLQPVICPGEGQTLVGAPSSMLTNKGTALQAHYECRSTSGETREVTVIFVVGAFVIGLGILFAGNWIGNPGTPKEEIKLSPPKIG